MDGCRGEISIMQKRKPAFYILRASHWRSPPPYIILGAHIIKAGTEVIDMERKIIINWRSIDVDQIIFIELTPVLYVSLSNP